MSCTFVRCTASPQEALRSQNAEKLGIRAPIGHCYLEKMPWKPMKNYVKERRVMCHKQRIPALHDPFILGESFCLGQLSRNSLFDNALGLPTFWYHWATFLILLTSFFPCDFHPAVTKTVLSPNIRSVYLCCLNAIQNLSIDTSWLVTTTVSKHCPLDNSFIFCKIKANINNN